MKLVILLSAAAALFAQQPQIENGRVETRASAGSLSSQLAQFGRGPFWAGYSEPIAPGHRGDMCNERNSGAPLRLEGQTTLVVLIRIENSQVDQLRLTSPDCRLDAGGLPFYWVNNVPAAESVAWLKSNVQGNNPDRAISAIALHAGPQADQALDEFLTPAQPERIREKALFWLGNSRGARGLDVLLQTARNDKDPRMRSKALFWLAQKAGNAQARETIQNAVASDPELSVKEQAVFALRQLPNNEGVPALIDVARNHRDPAVRKKAMFWLGQSKDPRAVEFFAQVLKP